MRRRMVIVGAVIAMTLLAAPAAVPAQERDDDGFEPLLRQWNGRYHKGGWNHYGPGYFVLDPETGELRTHGGMGLMWFAEREFSDFELQLEFKTSAPTANSGVFLRVPGTPSSDDYIYHSFEIQIHDGEGADFRTGSVYDAEPPTHHAAKPTGEWNHYRIRFVGDHITVEINGQQVVDWTAEPRGKVEDFASSGYVGLQNHDHDSSVWFRNIRIKDLSADS